MDNILKNSVDSFIDVLSSDSPTPGGGSVAALSGCLAEALMLMVSNLTLNKEKYLSVNDLVEDTISKCQKSLIRFKDLINDDIKTYNEVSSAYRIKKSNDLVETNKRRELINKALFDAMVPPYEVMKEVNNTIKILESVYDRFNMNLISDFGVAVSLLIASSDSAYLNVIVNESLISKSYIHEDIVSKAKSLKDDNYNRSISLYNKIIRLINSDV